MVWKKNREQEMSSWVSELEQVSSDIFPPWVPVMLNFLFIMHEEEIDQRK